MGMNVKADERTHMLVLPERLMRQVKSLAASRAETMREWFVRATREQINRDMATEDGPRRRARAS